MVVLLAQGAQQLGDLGGTGGVEGRLDQILQLDLLFQACHVEVLFMYHTNDVINGVVVHRQTGVAGLGKGLRHLFQRQIVLHRDHIHAGGQDLFHLHVIKLDGAADQLAFPVGQLAVILGFADHGHQLALGDGVLLGAVDKVSQKALPLAEQPRQRGKYQHQQAEHRCNCGGYRFRHLLGKALGGHLAKNQHHHGQHHGGHRSATLCTQHLGENDGADGSCGNVHDIIADKDGGKQLIVFFSHCQHPGGRVIAVLGAAFQADLIQGRKCGLGCGEKGRECHQYYQRYPERHTAIVHKKGNHTQLSVLNLVLFTHCVPVVLQQCQAGFSVYKNVLSIVAISAMKSTSMLFSIITYSAHRCKRLACTPCTKPVKFSAEPMRCRHNPPSGCCPRHNCP